MRERAGQLRSRPPGAVRASWTAHLSGPFGLSIATAAFLGLVGAFGSSVAPLWQRIVFFLPVGLGCGVLVSACVWTSQRIPWLAARPVARRAAIALALTPLCAIWIWVIVGYAFMHGPNLAVLPVYLGYSLIMSVAMTALSWAIFRPRVVASAADAAPSAPKFMARLPFRLREAELYAVEAEDHYLRVRTSLGSDLILMRLSDALEELEGLGGARTHRSWWVARSAIADVKRADGRAVLVLKDGALAPVSRTHTRALRQAGWL